MSRQFNLILTGNTLPGQARDEVATALAALMRLPVDRARGLLSGRETVIKRGLDEKSLQPYLDALHKAGVETRKDEIPSVPDSVAPEMIKCPACGLEQQNLTICRQCGVDMPNLLAAKKEAARNLPPSKPQTAAPDSRRQEADPEVPRYRRSRVLEIMLFLFVSVLWGYLAMTDSTRSRGIRIAGGAVFVLFGYLILQGLPSLLNPDDSRDQVIDAFNYAAEVSDEVGRYAVANQRLPEQTDAIKLPGSQPSSVKSVDVGPGGRVRVTLSDDLKEAAGAAIMLTPNVENGVIQWACASENMPAGYLGDHCG